MSEDNNNPVFKLVMDKLQQITPTVQSLMPDGSKTLVQAFISGRLDYCNSLLYGMTDSLFGAERGGQADHTDRSE